MKKLTPEVLHRIMNHSTRSVNDKPLYPDELELCGERHISYKIELASQLNAYLFDQELNEIKE